MDVQKDIEYSDRMLNEGKNISNDESSDYQMELPKWADNDKISRAQIFFIFNANAMVRAMYLGLTVLSMSQSMLKIFNFTGQSSTPAKAYKRFKINSLHAQIWYGNAIEPGTKAWDSIQTIRTMHVVMNKISVKAGRGIISQTDMALAQFVFMGFTLLFPSKFGIVGSRMQFESYNHFWRLVGHLLGIDDRFNCCGETVGESRRRLKSIAEDFCRPAMMFPSEECNAFLKTLFEGIWHSDPTLHHDSALFHIKRTLEVPGYHFFDSESSMDPKVESVFKKLSFYTKIRIILDIIIFEYLSKFFLFRLIFNISRFFLHLIDVFPILAIINFGSKNAHVKVSTSKRSQSAKAVES